MLRFCELLSNPDKYSAAPIPPVHVKSRMHRRSFFYRFPNSAGKVRYLSRRSKVALGVRVERLVRLRF